MATDKKPEALRPVEERLKTLYELQTVYTEIFRLREVRGELPKEVQDLESLIDGLNRRRARIIEKMDQLKAQRVDEVNKIENKRLLIDRYNQQLDNVRNNHEFDNLTKEIEYENLEIELAEKNIRGIDHAMESHAAEVEATEREIADQQHILTDKKEALDSIISETRDEEEKLIERAHSLEPLVDERTLKAYKRIRENALNGLGIVPVDRNACGGCFNRIPPQKQIEIRTGKRIIQCEYCGRILISPELAAEAKGLED